MKTALWDVFFALFFAVLMFLGVSWLEETGRFTTWVPLGDFLLMALALFRLIRLTSYDLITKFIRDAFVGKPQGTFLGTLGALVNCPWCVGLWWSFFMVFFYFATPYAWPVILILALAGVASFLQILVNLIGWSAEEKKRKVLDAPNAGGHTSTCG
ncbi:MAG: DUF1360 domain-containing protein [Candidatus Pacebacteria bacterium]|nr:DUF1360 domain-containing protein [Candidatus Paceibacterota bacterium]